MNMAQNTDILVVSGLPRSGTSLMMAMLERADIPIVTDGQRSADEDNPRGYYELEKVKQLKQDSTWIPEARGMAVKVVSSLLYDLPLTEQYRVLFMQRNLDEVLSSQEKMLERRGQPLPARDKMAAAFRVHLERLFEWIHQQPCFELLVVNYNELMKNAAAVVAEVAEFAGPAVDAEKMRSAIDPDLYRNRVPTDSA